MRRITLRGAERSLNKVLKTNAVCSIRCRGIRLYLKCRAQGLELSHSVLFLLDVLSHTPRQPAHAHRDPGGKPSGTRVYCPSLRFSQSTLDDSGHNQGRPSPTVRAVCRQLAPTQGCQDSSCTECEIHVVVAMRSISMSLLPRSTRAPTERHSSPVLSGSEVALPGLVEIPKSPDQRHRY